MAGDLERPGQLEQLVARRSHNKEIILITSNSSGARLAFNLLLSLHAQGIYHYIWITDDPMLCKALYYGPLRVACGWTSYLAVRFLVAFSRFRLEPLLVKNAKNVYRNLL
jgi:hypothetical protein